MSKSKVSSAAPRLSTRREVGIPDAAVPLVVAAAEPADWRAGVPPASRHRIINKIVDTLSRHLPFSGQEGQHELRGIAIRFEAKIYAAATSQSDYLRKISLKMLTMETSARPISQNPVVNSFPSASATSEQ